MPIGLPPKWFGRKGFLGGCEVTHPVPMPTMTRISVYISIFYASFRCCKYTPTQLHSHDDLMNFKFLLNSSHWTQSMHLTLPQVSAFQKSCWKSPPAWRELRLQPATPPSLRLRKETSTINKQWYFQIPLQKGDMLWHGNWHCIDLSVLWNYSWLLRHQACFGTISEPISIAQYKIVYSLCPELQNRIAIIFSHPKGEIVKKVKLVNKSCCFQTHPTFLFLSRSIPKCMFSKNWLQFTPFERSQSSHGPIAILQHPGIWAFWVDSQITVATPPLKLTWLHLVRKPMSSQICTTFLQSSEIRWRGLPVMKNRNEVQKQMGKPEVTKKLEQHWTTNNNHLKHETTIKVTYSNF